MHAQLIVDNRTDPSQAIRSQSERRTKSTYLISKKYPVLDSNGELIVENRRYLNDRRG